MKNLSSRCAMLKAATLLTAILIISSAELSIAEVNLRVPVKTEFAATSTVNLDSVVTVNGAIKPHIPCAASFRNYTSQAKSPGQGGVSEGKVITVNPGVSLVVYRAYSARFNNSIGRWWSAHFQYNGPAYLPNPVTTTISTSNPNAAPISYSTSPAIVGAMTEGDYRSMNAICKTWNDLDRMVVCLTKPGATFMIGKTQSVNVEQCEGSWVDNKQTIIYPANDTLQLFINPDQIDLATCTNYALQWQK